MSDREDFEDYPHVATIEVRATKDGYVMWAAVGDENGSWQPVPDHLAAQLPMVLNMMKSQLGS